MDSDESDTDDVMETKDAIATETVEMDTGEVDSAKPKGGIKAKPRRGPPVASSGLPQSQEELEALISSIHHTVTQSILPRLHKCLVAKVSVQFYIFIPRVLGHFIVCN